MSNGNIVLWLLKMHRVERNKNAFIQFFFQTKTIHDEIEEKWKFYFSIGQKIYCFLQYEWEWNHAMCINGCLFCPFCWLMKSLFSSDRGLSRLNFKKLFPLHVNDFNFFGRYRFHFTLNRIISLFVYMRCDQIFQNIVASANV